MLAVKGIYKDGNIILNEKVDTDKPVEVIITFLDEIESPSEKKLDISNFSFNKSRELLKNLKSSLSQEIIEERRSEI